MSGYVDDHRHHLSHRHRMFLDVDHRELTLSYGNRSCVLPRRVHHVECEHGDVAVKLIQVSINETKTKY